MDVQLLPQHETLLHHQDLGDHGNDHHAALFSYRRYRIDGTIHLDALHVDVLFPEHHVDAFLSLDRYDPHDDAFTRSLGLLDGESLLDDLDRFVALPLPHHVERLD